MIDGFEFTLHSPLTKEDWDKITDVEYENTMSVIFQTPQGRQVRYIKCEVLDKIRAEIEPKCDRINSLASVLPYTSHREIQELLLEIMDLCKAESEADKNRKFDCTDCVLDGTDACPRGAGRAVDSEVCEDFLKEGEEE